MAVQTTYTYDIPAALPGQLISAAPGGIIAMTNAEASASIAPGRAVAHDEDGDDLDCTLPAEADDVIVGIALRSQVQAPGYSGGPGDLDSNGDFLPGATMQILRKGVIWVTVEDDVTAFTSRLWVRRTAGGDPEFLGGLTDADDSTDTIDCTSQGVFLTTATAGNLAQLEVDFTAKQADAS